MTPRTLLLASVNADALPSWPVAWGVPLAPGDLREPVGLVVEAEDGQPLPTQLRALARHLDASISRLLVTAEPSVPADGERTFTLRPRAALALETPALADSRSITGAAGTLGIAEGNLAVDTSQGRYELTPHARGGAVSGQGAPLTWQQEKVEPYESGPVAASAVVHGAFHRDGDPILQVRLTLRLFASTPVLLCDVMAKNLSAHREVLIESFELRVARVGAAAWSQIEYEVRNVPEVRRAGTPLTVRASKLRLDFETPEGRRAETSRLLSFNETWFAAGSAGGDRLVLGVRNFFEDYPYGVSVGPEAVTVEFLPASHGSPWKLVQGSGRTHELALAVLGPDSAFTPRAVGYAHGKPPLARVAFDQFRQAPSLSHLPEYRPNDYPRVETVLFDLAYNRNRGYGKMNHGDDYSALYTNQLRGEGEIVWNNLEGDHPYHMFCQFARTGRYFYYKEFLTSLGHWSDVDFCDRSDDPLREGALVMHSAGHVSGPSSPCHNWAEGFKEWFFSTGNPRGREVLEKMADWIVRQDARGFFKTAPEPYVRGCGWGLVQIAAMQEVLARPDLEALARRLCDELLAYCRARAGLAMTIPTGGTWVARDNAFHTATVVIGAYQCWKLYGAPAMRELAVLASHAFMDERTCTPEGIAVYISGPEQDFPMQQAATFAMAALGIAYYLTGEERYVARGMRMLEYCLDRGMIVDHMRIPGEFRESPGSDDAVLGVMQLMPNSQLLSYQLRGLLMFMRAGHEAGTLKSVEYRH